MGGASSTPRLVVLGPSHFCEKAKWALERYSIQVDIDTQAPGFHSMATKGKGSTPCLIFQDGTFKDDSTLILHWIDEQPSSSALPKLFPADCAADVEAECARLDAGLGVDARLIVYAHAFDSIAVYEALTLNTPGWQQALFAIGVWPVVKGVMRDRMHISLENGVAALERVRAEYERVSALLADGRQYLYGNKFTAADLTFCALSIPVLGVSSLFEKHEKPLALQQIHDELRATPAGAYAVRILEQQRKVVL